MMPKEALYCRCGGAIRWSVGRANVSKQVREAFLNVHSGEGHELTDARTAARARSRDERRVTNSNRGMATTYTVEGGE